MNIFNLDSKNICGDSIDKYQYCNDECHCCLDCKNELMKNNLSKVLERMAIKDYDNYSEIMVSVDKCIEEGRYKIVIKILNELLSNMIQDLDILELNDYKSNNQCHIYVKDENDYRTKLLIVITKLIDCCYASKDYINAEAVLKYVINTGQIPDIDIFRQSYTLALIEYNKMNYEMSYEYFVNLVNNIHLVDCELLVQVKMRLKYCFVLFTPLKI